MKINITEKRLQYWVVLWIILFSGSLYLNILRIKLTMIIVGITILYVAIRFNAISRKNFIYVLTWLGISGISSVVNIRYGLDINEIILFAEKLMFVATAASLMSFECYKTKFVNIMAFEAALSVICFLYVDVFAISALPLQEHVNIAANGYYLTPYYTVGWEISPLLHRNAGIFSEPGAHQICLNYALLYLMSDSKQLNLSKGRYYFSIISLVVAIFTTMSTSGYLCLGVVIISSMVAKTEKELSDDLRLKQKKNLFKLFAVFALVALYFVESNFHIIEYKMSGAGSYATRMNETTVGYDLALKRPLIGHGMFNASNVLRGYEIQYMSNGLASFLIGTGLVVGGIFLLTYFLKLGKAMPYGILFQICAFAVFLVCTNSSSGVLNPVNLIFIMNWLNPIEYGGNEEMAFS